MEIKSDHPESPCRQTPSGQQKVPFANETWFGGKMSREKSEELLNNWGMVGDFLVRESESQVRIFILSFVY